MARDLDVVVFGATGSTGRLVAEHLIAARRQRPLRLALAGRDREKLTALAAELAGSEPPPETIVVDAHDRPGLDALAARTTAVATTVGPYQKYGSELVAACAAAGTHYADITGEVHWIREMIDAHHETARRTGARIVHCCGFDSVPSDLAVAILQREMTERFGGPADDVVSLFGETRGKFGGGTIATMLATIDAAKDPAVRRVLGDPYALDPVPGTGGPDGRDATGLGYEKRLGLLTAPFVMAAINTRIVRRTNAILGYPYGREFRYREVMSLPRSPRGVAMGVGIIAGLGGMIMAARSKRLRPMLEKRMPKPGEGPDAETRAKGHYIVRILGEHSESGDSRLALVGDRLDPGHGSTAKMLGESVLCLALDRLDSEAGVLTPAAAMGWALVERLRAVGMQLEVTDPPVAKRAAS